MAVKYAFEVFEQDQLESRYLLLLSTSDRFIYAYFQLMNKRNILSKNELWFNVK